MLKLVKSMSIDSNYYLVFDPFFQYHLTAATLHNIMLLHRKIYQKAHVWAKGEYMLVLHFDYRIDTLKLDEDSMHIDGRRFEELKPRLLGYGI